MIPVARTMITVRTESQAYARTRGIFCCDAGFETDMWQTFYRADKKELTVKDAPAPIHCAEYIDQPHWRSKNGRRILSYLNYEQNHIENAKHDGERDE